MPTITKDQISRPKMNAFNSWDSIDQRVIDNMERTRRKSSVASSVDPLNVTKRKGKERDPDIYGEPSRSGKSTETPFNIPIPPIPADFVTQVNRRPTISRTSTMRDRDLIELKSHLEAIDRDRTRDLESQVRIQTQQYRMGWRSVLQIGAAFVSTCTLAIAITNLTDRLQREARGQS